MKMTIQSVVLLFLNILLLLAGQVLWKIGLGKLSFSIMNLLQSPYIWAGLVLYAAATYLWLKVLSIVPLSIAYPIQSVVYILALIPAIFLFGEYVPWTRWAGCCVILIGVFLVTLK